MLWTPISIIYQPTYGTTVDLGNMYQQFVYDLQKDLKLALQLVSQCSLDLRTHFRIDQRTQLGPIVIHL